MIDCVECVDVVLMAPTCLLVLGRKPVALTLCVLTGNPNYLH
jgi:hypothetical protein